MTPTDSDCSSPNGLPIAATGAPTCRSSVEPSGSGRSVRPAGSTRSSATSAFGIEADDPAPRPGCRRRSARRRSCALADGVALAAGHDVGVRRDLAVAGDDEARAEARVGAGAAGRRAARGDDRHDARRLALVDRARVEAARALPRLLEDLDVGVVRCTVRVVVLRRRRSRQPAGAAAARPPAQRRASRRELQREGRAPGDATRRRGRPSMRSASSCAIARPRPEPCASSEV